MLSTYAPNFSVLELAACYGRLDLVRFLVEEKKMSLSNRTLSGENIFMTTVHYRGVLPYISEDSVNYFLLNTIEVYMLRLYKIKLEHYDTYGLCFNRQKHACNTWISKLQLI